LAKLAGTRGTQRKGKGKAAAEVEGLCEEGQGKIREGCGMETGGYGQKEHC